VNSGKKDYGEEIRVNNDFVSTVFLSLSDLTLPQSGGSHWCFAEGPMNFPVLSVQGTSKNQ